MEMIVLHGKWGTEHITNVRGLGYAALDIVRNRLDDGFWYDNWDDGNPAHQWESRAQSIVAAEDPDAAWAFLTERSDHEYEGFETAEVPTGGTT